jgi:hypothetical protein
MTEAARAVGVDDLENIHDSQAHKQICRDWDLKSFHSFYSLGGRDQYHRKALYYNLKPNSVFKRLQIPAVIDVSKIKEDKRNWKIREPKAAVGTCPHSCSCFKRRSSVLFASAWSLWPMVPFR